MTDTTTLPRWRRIVRTLFAWGISFTFGLVLLEIGCLILVRSGYLPARLPTYSLPESPQPFLMDMDPHFGVWHASNASRHHLKKCFDVTYRSNSYGAVDRERPRNSDRPRAVVMGDSFVEGFGVDAADRFTDRLEALTGVPQLNFGTSGHFGPTQYFLLYKHLASQFDHDDVLVGILPYNDFFDDNRRPPRYSPYWDGTYPDYTLRYSVESLAASEGGPSRFDGQKKLAHYGRNFTHLFNVYDWLRAYQQYVRTADQLREGTLKEDYSGYYKFTEEQLLRMRYSLERIRELAVDKRVLVFTIPVLHDISRYDATGVNPLREALQRMGREVGFEYLDLLPAMHERFNGHWNDLYHSCDGHFSPVGHDVAATLLQESFYP